MVVKTLFIVVTLGKKQETFGCSLVLTRTLSEHAKNVRAEQALPPFRDAAAATANQKGRRVAQIQRRGGKKKVVAT